MHGNGMIPGSLTKGMDVRKDASLDVIGIDDLPVVDYLLQVEALPKTNDLVTAVNPSWQCGGKVATAMAALGRLNAKAGMIGIVGDDKLGAYCLEDFKRHGVDISRMIIDPGKTTTFSICLAEQSTQGRSFIGVHGTRRQLQSDDIPEDYIQTAKYLHLCQMIPAAIHGAKTARKYGLKVAFDGDLYEKAIDDNLDLIDIFIASEFFYKQMFNDPGLHGLEKNCFALKDRGPEIVIVTLGPLGSAGVCGKKFFKIPGFKVNVVDTTGAGDVFHGAFLYGILQQYDIEYAVRFANAVSAIKCTRQGGRAGIPRLETVNRFLADGFIDYTDIDQRLSFYREGIWNC
jgi:sugar/nucleoside kinase (ribokinase family)